MDNLSYYNIGLRPLSFAWNGVPPVLILIKSSMLIKKKNSIRFRLLILFLVNHMYPPRAIVETNPLKI
jgi:hypothetical protein